MASSSRYVPPHLRKQTSSAGQDVGSTKEEMPERPESYTIQDLAAHYKADSEVHATLNRGAVDPTRPSHILLFYGAHPEWPPKFYCKTNIELLQQYPTAVASDGEASGNPSGTVPAQEETSVPVYVEVRPSKFEFLGYFTIVSATFLEPRSEALINLLETKFQRGDSTKARRPSTWKASLNLRWAIVTLEPDEARAGEECGVVKLPQMSVTEKLNELRMRDKEREDAQQPRKREKESDVVPDASDDAQSEARSLVSGSLVDKADKPASNLGEGHS